MIDTNTFLGPWPFLPVPARTGRQLTLQLRRYGIHQALTSHLGAVFQPEPMPANRELFSTTRGLQALVPIPILNPSLATWSDQLNECMQCVSLRAVRIIPAFHNYSLRHRALERFLNTLRTLKLRLILQVRLEDERNRYFGLKVAASREADVDFFLQRFPEFKILCAGLYKGEIERLAKKHDHFLTDIAFAEHLTTVETLRRSLPARRILFGSGTPILSVPAQLAKLSWAELPGRERALIEAGNARRFFAL